MTNTTTAIVPVPQRVEQALFKREDDLREILGDPRMVKRFIKTAIIAIAKNPALQKCTIESLVIGIVEAAEVGIEPTGSLSRGWLVPFKNKKKLPNGREEFVDEAQLIIGWMGLIDLAKDSEEVSKVTARVVYEGDEFGVEQGTDERIVHVPRYATEDPTKITHAYMVATQRDGNTVHEVMTKAQIDEVRAKAKAANGPAWVGSYPEMARKTVVRRGVKYLHLTPKARLAIERDDEREFGDLAAPVEKGAKTANLRDALAAKAAAETEQRASEETASGEEIEGTAVEVDAQGNPVEAPPPESADGQTAVCGATSDPQLGDVESCVLPADHLTVKGSKQRHQAESGSIWPAAKEEK